MTAWMRKKLFKNTVRRQAGFTMPEMLMVVAIIAILSAVGFVAAATMLRNARQAASDKAAESIYTAVQEYLQEVYAFSQDDWKSVFYEDGKPVTTPAALSNDTGETGLIYVAESGGEAVTAAPVSGATQKTPLEMIFNDGSVLSNSVSGEFYSKNIVVEFNPRSAQVYAVFYGDDDKHQPDVFYNAQKVMAVRGGGDGTDSSGRKEEFGGHVGYYQSRTQNLADPMANSLIVKVDNMAEGKSGQLYNYDELKAELYCRLPENYEEGQDIRIQVSVAGQKSKAAAQVSMHANSLVALGAGYQSDTKTLWLPLALDNLEAGRCFSEVFKDQANLKKLLSEIPNSLSQTAQSTLSGTFLPGEDITVTATVGLYSDAAATAAMLSDSDTAEDNSLFAYGSGTQGGEYQAYIAYGRHLQNLDSAAGGLAADAVQARQVKDIDFDELAEDESDEEFKRLWRYVYTPLANRNNNGTVKEGSQARFFVPVTNDKVQSYTGTFGEWSLDEDGKAKWTADSTKQPFSICGLKIDETKPEKSGRTDGAGLDNAGLFAVFSGTDAGDPALSAIRLVHPQIRGTDTGNAGGLAGKITGNVTVSDCQLHILNKESTDTAEKDWLTAWKEAPASDANEDGVTDANDAADWLSGGKNAGGLVGEAAGSLTVKDSFAATVVRARATDGMAGGLAGKADGPLAVVGSYADCYIAAGDADSDQNGTIGGLAGECGEGSSFTNCYSAGFVLGSAKTAAGFVPSPAAAVSNSYTVFNFDDITTAGTAIDNDSADTINNKNADNVTAGGVTAYPAVTNVVTEKIGLVKSVTDAGSRGWYLNGGAAPEALPQGAEVGTAASLAELVDGSHLTQSGWSDFAEVSHEQSSSPYHLAAFFGSALDSYPFPLVETGDGTILSHKSDWLAKPEQGTAEAAVDNDAILYAKVRVPVDREQTNITLTIGIGDNGTDEEGHRIPSDTATFRLRDGSKFDPADPKKGLDPDSNKNVYCIEETDDKGVTYAVFYAILDDITTKGLRFADLFAEGGAKLYTQDGTLLDAATRAKFYPGVNITSVTASINGGESVFASDMTEKAEENTDEAVPVWNSLYGNDSFCADADRSVNNPQTAIIKNFRHLENLDKRIAQYPDRNTLAGSTSMTAKQEADLIWEKANGSKNGFVEKIEKFKNEMQAGGASELAIYSGATENSKPYNESEVSYQPVNLRFTAGETFTYDGNSHKIQNLYVKAPEVEDFSGAAIGKTSISDFEKQPDDHPLDAGVFGFVEVTDGKNTSAFTVQNLTLDEADIEYAANSGGLIGRINLLTRTNANASQSKGSVTIKNVDSQGDSYVYGRMLIEGGAAYARGYAGGLLGTVNEANLTVTDCHIYGEKAFVYNDSNEAFVEGMKTTYGGGSAGGLIASMQWCNSSIDKCSATVYVYGEEADTTGGLVGRSYTGTSSAEYTRITDSYVGGHTRKRSYQEGVFRRGSNAGASNVSGYNDVGGFLGYCQGNIAITDSFSAASVYGAKRGLNTDSNIHIGGFLAYANSLQSITVKNCNMTGRVYVDSNYNKTKTGLFIGETSRLEGIERNKVLDGINNQSNHARKLVGNKEDETITADKRVSYTVADLRADDEAETTIYDKRWKNWDDGDLSDWQDETAENEEYYGDWSSWNGRTYPYKMPEAMHYYGDWELPEGDKAFDLDWSIVNQDKLSLKFKLPKSVIDEDRNNCWISLKLQGATSKKKYYGLLWFREYGDGKQGSGGTVSVKMSMEDPKDVFDGWQSSDDVFKLGDAVNAVFTEETDKYTVDIVLDDITKNNGHFAQKFPELYPGEDVKVYVAVGRKLVDKDTDALKTDDESAGGDASKKDWPDIKTVTSPKDGTVKMMKTNSLFASGSVVAENASDVANQAEIRWGRHLQNLDPVVSGINKFRRKDSGHNNGRIFTSAVQTKNIDWDDFVDTNKADGEKPVIYSYAQNIGSLKNALTEKGEYYGVYNRRLTSYSGNMGSGKKAQISNIKSTGHQEKTIGASGGVKFAEETDLGSDKSTYYDKGYAAGLFRGLDSDATISDLKLTSFVLRGYNNQNGAAVGTLVGNASNSARAFEGVIKNIEIDGTDVMAQANNTNAHAGGLVGLVGIASSGKKETLKIENVKITGNLKIESKKKAAGLVGYVDSYGEVTMDQCSILADEESYARSNTTEDAGGAIGGVYNNGKAEITNIKIQNLNVIGNQAGGVVGKLSNDAKGFVAENVHAYGAKTYVYGKESAGGFVGYVGSKISGINVDSCSASVYVTAETKYAGGFIGCLMSGTSGSITNSYAGGHTKASPPSANYVNDAALTKTGNDVDVTTKGGYNVYGKEKSGGFVGYKENACDIAYCFTTASVSGASGDAAGFCNCKDASNAGSIKNSYAAGTVFAGNLSNQYVFCDKNVGSGNLYLDNSLSDNTVDSTSNAQSITIATLKSNQSTSPSTVPSHTIRFDGAASASMPSLLNYPFPFYVGTKADDMGKVFYGDWAEASGVTASTVVKTNGYLTISFQYTDTDGTHDVVVYYYDGKFHASPP